MAQIVDLRELNLLEKDIDMLLADIFH